MLSYASSPRCPQFADALAPFLSQEGLPFANVLSAEAVDRAFAAEGVPAGTAARTLFTPAVTLWAFLSQVVHEAKSCRAAVLRVAALYIALGRRPCAEDTAAYCRARAHLPTPVLKRLALEAGRNLEGEAPADWRWHGRRVTPVDGTTLTLADTPANQRAYPQPPCQKPGLGFPMIRLVVLLGYATAALTGLAFGPYQGKDTGEPSLFRPLLADLVPGDIVVADRYYCTYWLVALALARGVDVTFRLHHGRVYDFRRGRRLGPDDHVVSWRRPARPDWMDAATYATMPATVTVRELRVRVTTPGFRPEELILATTLTDAAVYAHEDIADLYHKRWLAELDIRAIKRSLRMEHLRCRTPAMMEKALWVHFLAYNLVRKVSAQAARTQGIRPREVSFTGTRDAVAAFWSQLTVAGTAAERLRQGQALLQRLGTEKVGQRPDRYEPRLVKRRAKPYKLLQKPRAEARADLLRKRHR